MRTPDAMRRHGTLEIPEDVAFERRAWKVQRAGWVVMLLVLLAAVAGVFGGGGPLSQAEVAAERLSLRYERFTRNHADTRLELEVTPGPDGRARVWLARDYVEHVELVGVVPAPEAMASTGAAVRLTFVAADPREPVRVRVHARPQRAGLLRGALGVEGGGRVTFTQVSYP